MMDPQSILKLPKEYRRTFVGLLCAIFLVALLLDWHLSTLPIVDTLLGYVRAIAAAIITSLFVLWVICSFMPLPRSKARLVELQPKQITNEFENLLSVATRWRYKGNFGRYMRGKVLPTLAGKQNLHISVCIIDPMNTDLCEKHARYRSQISAIDKGKRYDADSVALEVVVTVVICAWYLANRRAAIELYLSPVFDPVRIDSNDEAMILTVEDRRSPALMVTREHFTYEHFELQMEFARSQSRPLTLEGVREGIQLAELEEEDVVAVLKNSGMQEICQRLTPQRILQGCRESKNPYEN